MDHQDFMNMAYRLAFKGRGRTSPNPLVGAVLVKSGRVISVGWHKHCGADHAEIVALNKAGTHAKGASLYVTLEPCCHYGRTPPCVDQIIQSGIRSVYVGMVDPNSLVNGRSIAKMRRAGIDVQVGFMRKELERMNESFIKYIKYRVPFVVVKTAQTLDGKTATASGRSKWITSLSARTYARRLRNDFDAILVGIRTVLKDDPRLTAAARSKRIKKIIIDASLRISPRARLFSGAVPADCFIVTTPKADPAKIDLFRRKGINVLVYPQRQGHIQFKLLLKELAKREITSILIEGGAHTVGRALSERIVDKMHIYIAPKIIGDQKALSAVTGLRVAHLSQAVQLKDLEIKKIEKDIFIQGYVHRHH